MEILTVLNRILAALFTVCYAYQFAYILVVWTKRRPKAPPAEQHRYAVLICARNEQAVIGDLLESLRQQTYDRDKLQLFVMADNCTDATALIARQAGATVYERFSQTRIGKGYALEQLLENIRRDWEDIFDGYFVFDADNVLQPDYVENMNRTFSAGYEIVTSYRASKNYGDSWVSAGYGLWFLRESWYLNQARMLLGTSCAVSGTGFLFSRNVLERSGGWPFHLLTEDIEFSVHHIIQGAKIGFCADAVLFDEQPVTFRQSWRQRLRWAKGYLQVFQNYGRGLVGGALRGSFSCYDMSMVILPAFFITVAELAVNLVGIGVELYAGTPLLTAIRPFAAFMGGTYGMLLLIGSITTVTQWKHIYTPAWKKLLYNFTFPLFMFTYLPISIQALFAHVEWKPIEHHVPASALKTAERRIKPPAA